MGETSTTGNGDGDGSKKRVKISGSDHGTDDSDVNQLSRLPDHVLLHLLTYLLTKDMVRTVLVPKFRALWPFIQELSFDYSSDHYVDASEYVDSSASVDMLIWDHQFWDLVRNVLRLHQSPTIRKFFLRAPFHFLPSYSEDEEDEDEADYQNAASGRENIKREIDACVRFAVAKKVQVLVFNLQSRSGCKPNCHYKLSSDVFQLSSLTSLALGCCQIDPKGHISLVSLKKLCLQTVALPDDMMDGILLGCPLLETLCLTACSGLNKLTITNPNTKNLFIYGHQRIQIFSPSLLTLSLGISGWIGGIDLVNVSSLESVTIDFDSCFETPTATQAAMVLLEKFHHAKAMKIYNFTTKVFVSWDLTKVPSPFFNWKIAELGLLKMHLPGFSKFLANSPYLQTLALDIYGYKPIVSPHSTEQNYWSSNGGSFRCLEHHMKTIKVFCEMEPYVFHLVEFLLNTAAVLEKMVISVSMLSTPKSHASLDTLRQISEQVLSYHKASSRAVIHVIEGPPP